MKIVKFVADKKTRFGLVDGDTLGELPDVYASMSSVAEAALTQGRLLEDLVTHRRPLRDVTLLAPIDSSSRIFAIAQNYPAHAAEYGGPRPPAPVVFLKPASAMAAPGTDVEIPPVSTFFDYEGELGVMVGRHGRNLSVDEALAFVAGYTPVNDGSARDLLPATLGGKEIVDWFSGKSLDSSSPMGPWIVTSDEVVNAQDLQIQTRLNGQVVQDDRTSSMIFSIAEQLAFVSQRTALMPGDLFATGTPSGVGFARGRSLQAGDLIEIEVEHVGVLRTCFVAPMTRA